ncbi:hypothetical protein [uncultured Lacinutrix sp.]|uniref:hypothetical protein n=1 Tax=uncultured Lacinutrix sp. TaxID=574032 RepID=UPI00262334C4|nr:hypothetical protein [uncultured Lacinutrix sp.]
MLKIKQKFPLLVIVAFIFFTIIGTITHEFGHISVANFFGYETTLHYGSMEYIPKGYNQDEDVILFDAFNDKYKNIKYEDLDESIKKEADLLLDRINNKFNVSAKHSFLITLGGPVQTVLTSVFGLLILYYRKSKKRPNFNIWDWLGVFMSLFILREVFNTLSSLFKRFFYNTIDFYGDEFRISRYLDLNQWIIPIITCLIGLAISSHIIFKVIPKQYRFSFIIGGLIGGISGFAIWFGFLGKLILP